MTEEINLRSIVSNVYHSQSTELSYIDKVIGCLYRKTFTLDENRYHMVMSEGM